MADKSDPKRVAPQFESIAVSAMRLNKSVTFVKRAVASGDIRSVKLRGSRLIPIKQFEEMLAA